MLSLTKVTLDIVKVRYSTDVVFITESIWEKQNRNSYLKRQINKPFWVSLLHKADGVIKEKQEYIDFISVLESDEITSNQLDTPVGSYLGSIQFEARHIASKAIYEFLIYVDAKASNNLVISQYSLSQHYFFIRRLSRYELLV